MSSNNFNLRFKNSSEELQNQLKLFLKKNIFEKYGFEKQDQSNYHNSIIQNTLSNIEYWLCQDIPSEYKEYVFLAIDEKRWSDIIESFYQELDFGTSGIRGKISISLDDQLCENQLNQFLKFNVDSTVLRGTNTVNEIMIAKYAKGLAHYMKKRGMTQFVVGYDNRIMSKVFARIVTKIFLKNELTVFFFNDITSFPELCFSLTTLGADLGIEITASHNDKRHNGVKIITELGSPPNSNERNEMAKEIFMNNETPILLERNDDEDFIKEKLKQNKLIYLGNKSTLKSDNTTLTEIQHKYINQIKKFVLQPGIIEKYGSLIKIGYSASNGTGSQLILRLLNDVGFDDVKTISNLNYPNPTFPSFPLKQILDPSDEKVSQITINEFIKEYGEENLERLDILIYSDPDADRLGFIAKVPIEEQKFFGKWKFIKANDIYTLILWYYLKNLFDSNPSLSKKNDLFIVKSYVTSDSIDAVAKKFKILCLNGKVGFSDLSNIVREFWKKGKINVGMFEESNGIGVAGSLEKDSHTLSHILEKDAALAAILIAEVCTYAKSQNTTIIELLNQLYLDSEIGYYATFRLDLPEEKMFGGIATELYKQQIIKNAEKIAKDASEKIKNNSIYHLANVPISRIEKYSTGRYDKKYWKNFPDEGIRFFLSDNKGHITIRSSGTESKIRIFVQYKIYNITKENLPKEKFNSEKLVQKIAFDVKQILEQLY